MATTKAVAIACEADDDELLPAVADGRDEDLPWERRDHALFVGYAPYDNPRYAISVVVEHGGGGSHVAAPIARDAILRALHGEMPPLSSYPDNQRGRIETDLEALKLRLRDAGTPGKSRA